MRINPKNFIDDYITNPLAKDISTGEKILSLTLSILLAPLTLGILHIRSAVLKHRHIKKINKERHEKFKQVEQNSGKSSLFMLMAKTKQVIGKHFNDAVKSANVLDTTNPTGAVQPVIPSIESYRILSELEESEKGEIVNTFITNYYSQPLPPKDKVTVPIRDDSGKIVERRWVDLTKQEKLQVNNTGTHAHNQIASATPEHIIDQWFFPGDQKPFLPGDPRESHGNDHCARAAIFSTVFAYLYSKYHPQYNVNAGDVTLCQIVAGGHDSGRQTEGPDVYDEKSAENTLEILKALGIKDESILKECKDAIADKDNKDLQTKSLIAKCVQNADCAEFARLLLKGRAQDSSSFNNSRNYLDIYNEFKKMNDAGLKELKYGFSFEDFCFELDSLRKEMNEFIYITHKKQFREQIAASQNYYQEMLNQITPIQFPLLHSVLEQVSIKKSPLTEDQAKLKAKVDSINEWKKYGFNNIPREKLSKMLSVLENAQNVDYRDIRITQLILDLKSEIESQELRENTYIEAKQLFNQDPTDENLNLLLTSYSHINYRFRNQHLKEIWNFVDTRKLDLNSEEMSFDLKDVKQAYQLIRVDIQHEILKIHLQSWNQPTKDLVIQYQEYCTKLQQMYHTIPEENRNPTVQTTVTLMMEKIATFYIENEDFESARKVLVDISNHSSIDKSNPFFDMKKCLASANGAEGNYLPSDSSFLRKRKMRVAQKLIGEQDLMELSFELPSNIRKQLEKKMRLWPSEEVDANYYRRNGKMGEEGFAFDQNNSLEIGKDLKFTFDGVEIFVGNTEEYWNQHNLVRVRFSKSMSTQDVHKALCKIGLPMALMPSRPEDLRQELLARSLNFRFPVLAAESKTQSIETVYNSLNADQKSIIDKDLEGAKMTLVGNDHIELVQPAIAKEAWERGVRSVGCFIWGGSNFVDTANVFKNILKRGLLSSLERFMCGILGLGCVPKLNYKAGSGNQVFTRILTKNLFEKNYALSNFPVSGHVFIMLDPKVLERMPYSYPFDRAGVRNPNYKESVFRAQKQKDIHHFRGEERIKDRKGFAELVNSLNEKASPLNETMFDLNIGSKYIQKIVVWSEQDRLKLIHELQKSGVYYINQTPLERAIVASTKLNPHMIDNFYQDTINKGDDDECEYI